jgi:hypothetical protein
LACPQLMMPVDGVLRCRTRDGLLQLCPFPSGGGGSRSQDGVSRGCGGLQGDVSVGGVREGEPLAYHRDESLAVHRFQGAFETVGCRPVDAPISVQTLESRRLGLAGSNDQHLVGLGVAIGRPGFSAPAGAAAWYDCFNDGIKPTERASR